MSEKKVLEQVTVQVTANGYVAKEVVAPNLCLGPDQVWTFESMRALLEFLDVRMSPPLESQQ